MRTPATDKRGRRRGAVLILTLWIALVLGLICYSMLGELQMEAKLTSLQKSDLIAFYAARAGVARAGVDLVNDMVADSSEPSQNFDALSDVWAVYDEFEEVRLAERGSATYTIRVTDEESKINLNTAGNKLLFGLLRVLGQDEIEAQRIAYAIEDWRDADTKPRGPASGGGQYESDYYANLRTDEGHARGGATLYLSKNDLFTTVDELRDVFGVTPEVFFGHTKANRKRRSRARRSTLSFSANRETEDEESTIGGLRDFLTVHSNGRINVNTAPMEVLAAIAIAYGRDVQAAKGAALHAISLRAKGSDSPNVAFKNVGEFIAATGFPAGKVPGVALDVRSRRFTVSALGRVYSGNPHARSRASRKPRILAEHTALVLVERSLNEYPLAPRVDDRKGVWEQIDYPSPPYKKLRPHPKKPGVLLDPVVRALQWIEW